MAQEKVYLELPPFTGRNVPIIEIAKAMHKDAQYVRVGLSHKNGWKDKENRIYIQVLPLPQGSEDPGLKPSILPGGGKDESPG